MTWVRRHIVVISLSFVLLFDALAIVGGNYTINQAARRDIVRNCETLRRAARHTDAKWYALLDYIESVSRAAGREPSQALKDIRTLVTDTDPIEC